MMKNKYLLFSVLTCSLFLFSFKSTELKPIEYNELSTSSSLNIKELEVGSFKEFEERSSLPDRTTWYKRVQTWSITDSTTSLDNIDKSVNSN